MPQNRSHLQQNTRRPRVESLEDRRMLSVDWRNPADNLDVNSDQRVSAIDALQVINELARRQGENSLDSPYQPGRPYVDVNGSSEVSPLDALLVINAIARMNGANERILIENDRFIVEQSTLVTVGQTSGERSLRVELLTQFADADGNDLSSDVVAVYIVDPEDSSISLIGDENRRDPVFSITANESRTVPGLSRWDGRFLDIDLTAARGGDTARIIVQSINRDGAPGSSAQFYMVSNSVETSAEAEAITMRSDPVIPIGGSVQTGGLQPNSTVEINERLTSYDRTSRILTTQFNIQTSTEAIGKTTVVTFPGLPDGVTLVNQSGDIDGTPYISLEPAIGNGGLGRQQRSQFVEVQFENSTGVTFQLQPEVHTGTANHAPQLEPLSPVSLRPGEVAHLPLQATDLDGDEFIVTLSRFENLPTMELTASNELIFRPSQLDVGSYSFDVIVDDGLLSSKQEFRIDIVEDPIQTTRVSGQVLDVDKTPLVNLPVELSGQVAMTDSSGAFHFDFGSLSLASNTLRIRGDLLNGDSSYPFVAEKLSFLLGRDVIAGQINHVARPIYLPRLNPGTMIDPNASTLVTTPFVEGAALQISPGTLVTQQGIPFSGELSITEVPPAFTPAALPEWMSPDLVVTIQPGDMVFTQPTPLTLPNRAGWAPGTEMELWSIDPVSGEFAKAGDAVVSDDGTQVETTSGGVRTSSWHITTPVRPRPVPPAPTGELLDPTSTLNVKSGCSSIPQECNFTSTVDVFTGSLKESHSTVPVVVQGNSQAVTLVYDSLRADPRPIFHGGIETSTSGVEVFARVEVSRGNFRYQIPGYRKDASDSLTQPFPDLQGGEHFFVTGDEPGPADFAIQADFRSFPSGVYDFVMDSARTIRWTQEVCATTTFVDDGVLFCSNDQFVPVERSSFSSRSDEGQITVVNKIESPYGNGWGIEGLLEFVRNPDGTVLLIDGNGEEEVFEPSPDAIGEFISPAGQFAELSVTPNQQFILTSPNGNVSLFDVNDRLSSMTDRNGNRTLFEYGDHGGLTSITDPLGGQTTFLYTDGKLHSITDSVGRVTEFSVDESGNLTGVVDPDGSTRNWTYDQLNHMTGEVDQLGRTETAVFDRAGRVRQAVRKDDSSIFVSPVDVQGLHFDAITTDPTNPALINGLAVPDSVLVNANGDATSYRLDSAGQLQSARDDLGAQSSRTRNGSNLVIEEQNSRSHKTNFSYDSDGNLIQFEDSLTVTAGQLTVPSGLISGIIQDKYDRDNYSIDFPQGGYLFLSASLLMQGDLSFSILDAKNQLYADVNARWPTFLGPGTYRLLVESLVDGPIAYEFRLRDFSQTVEIAVGESVSGVITSGTIVREIVGEPNSEITVNNSGSDSGTILTILSQNGDFLHSNVVNNDVSFTMPYSGRVYFLVQGNGLQNEYAYSYETSSVDGEPVLPLSGDEISLGQPVIADGNSGENQQFQFSIDQTTIGTIDALDGPGNLQDFQLRGPNGEIEINAVLVLRPGRYEITVPSGSVFQVGEAKDLSSLSIGVPIDVRVRHGEVHSYHLDLAPNSTYRVNIDGENFRGATWEVFDPSGNVVYRYSDPPLFGYQPLGDLVFSTRAGGSYVLTFKSDVDPRLTVPLTLDLLPVVDALLQPVEMREQISETLDFRGDKDLYSLSLSEPSNLHLEVDRSLPNLSFSLLNDDGEFVSGSVTRDLNGEIDSVFFENLLPGEFALEAFTPRFVAGDSVAAEYSMRLLASVPTRYSRVGEPLQVDLQQLGKRVFTFDIESGRQYSFTGANTEDLLITLRSTTGDSSSARNVSTNESFSVLTSGRYYATVTNTSDFSSKSLVLTLGNPIRRIGEDSEPADVPEFPAGQSVLPVSLGQLIEGQLGSSNPLTPSVAYSFSVSEQQQLLIDIRTSSFATQYWSLHSGADVLFDFSAESEGELPGSRILELPAGEYRLQVAHKGDLGNLLSDFSFRLVDLAFAQSIGSSFQQSATLGVNAFELFTLDLSAGDQLTANRKRLDSFGSTRFVLVDPDGRVAFSTQFRGVDAIGITQSGVHQILFESHDFRAVEDRIPMQYELGINNVATPEPVPVLLGDRTPFVLDAEGGRAAFSFSLESTKTLLFETDYVVKQVKGPIEIQSPNVLMPYRLPKGDYTVWFENTPVNSSIREVSTYLEVRDLNDSQSLELGSSSILNVGTSLSPAISFSLEAGMRALIEFDASLSVTAFGSKGNFVGLENVSGELFGSATLAIEATKADDYFLVLHNSFGQLPDTVIVDLRLLLTNGNAVDQASTQIGTFIEYDPQFSQITRVVDQLGRETLFEVDPTNGNRLSMRRVVGTVDTDENGDDVVTRYTYTDTGQLETMTDALGRVSRYEYDDRGRLVTMIEAEGTSDEATTRYEYDAAGNQTAVIDPRGNRTEFQYDAMNRVTVITEADPDGDGPLLSPITTFDYDLAGNLLSTTDASGSSVSYVYDERDQVVSATDDLDQQTRYLYDPVGNLREVIDPLGNTTLNSYDGRNRLERSVDPDGGVTLYEYDTDNNLVALTDPVGNRTQFVYDARNRMTEEIDSLGNSTLLFYDAVDKLIEKTDRNDRITTFAYDDLDRLVKETWIDPDRTTVVNTINYEYDKVGNLLQIFDQYSHLTYTYDSLNRVTSVDNAGTPDAPNSVLTYTYDSVGNVLTVSDTIDGVAGAVTEYEYDGLNRVKTIKQSGDNVSDKLIDYVYNEIGQYDQVLRYSDLARTNLVVETDYEYDEINRLADLRHTDNADEVLAFFTYGYDAASRITEITDFNGLTEFAYDNRSQLIEADRTDTDPRVDEFYQYDANGNRVASHLHGDGYETGPANRLLSDGTYEYEYDAEGNMIRRTNIESGEYRVFEWDHRNRLVGVADFNEAEVSINSAVMTYDAIDRRIRSTSDTDGAGPIEPMALDFVYDRMQVIVDVGRVDNSVRYLYGPTVDSLEFTEESEGILAALKDHLGSVVELYTENGSTEQVQFDAFGNFSGVESRIAFTGREFDNSLNLQFNRARYYDSSIGRFISQDPIGFEAYDWNLYRYVENRIISASDPYGLQSADSMMTQLQTGNALGSALLQSQVGILNRIEQRKANERMDQLQDEIRHHTSHGQGVLVGVVYQKDKSFGGSDRATYIDIRPFVFGVGNDENSLREEFQNQSFAVPQYRDRTPMRESFFVPAPNPGCGNPSPYR